MSGRNEPQNPLVITGARKFTQVGYPTSGTPMPVSNIGAGETLPTTLICGSLFPAGTAAGLVLGTATLHNSVLIQAYRTNTGTVFIGCSATTTINGIAMLARDTITVIVDDISKIYVNVTVGGEGVSYLGS